MMRMLPALVLLGLAAPALAQLDYDRARRNYLALQAGQAQLDQLSAIEVEEVRQLDAALGAQGLPQRDSKARCKARLEGSSAPTALEAAVNELKCAQRPD